MSLFQHYRWASDQSFIHSGNGADVLWVREGNEVGKQYQLPVFASSESGGLIVWRKEGNVILDSFELDKEKSNAEWQVWKRIDNQAPVKAWEEYRVYQQIGLTDHLMFQKVGKSAARRPNFGIRFVESE